jgi:serine/threonine protein phosphatase 1
MKRLVIGDIHGCYAELQHLLERAGLSAGDEIIALGDIVDRGPDSPRVLEFFQRHPQARSLMGNHERKHIRSFYGEIGPARSQRITRLQLGEAAYPEAVKFMASFSRGLDLPEAILVHGFWEPGRPLEEQLDTVVVGTLSGEHHLRRSYSEPWYAHYDGMKPLIVGHHDYLLSGQPLVYQDRVFGLDTGCCTGGALTGLILPDFRMVSVPSRADHWRQLQREYPDSRLGASLSVSPHWGVADQQLLERLYRAVQEEHGRIWAQLRRDPAFDSLPPRQQTQAYAEQVGDGLWAGLLHAERKGELDLRRVQHILRTPRRARVLARELAV